MRFLDGETMTRLLVAPMSLCFELDSLRIKYTKVTKQGVYLFSICNFFRVARRVDFGARLENKIETTQNCVYSSFDATAAASAIAKMRANELAWVLACLYKSAIRWGSLVPIIV